MIDINTLEKELVLTNEELTDLIETEREKMNMAVVVDMIHSIIQESEEQEPGGMYKAVPIKKYTYIAREAYIRGYFIALKIFNECVEEEFEKIKTGGFKNERDVVI